MRGKEEAEKNSDEGLLNAQKFLEVKASKGIQGKEEAKTNSDEDESC